MTHRENEQNVVQNTRKLQHILLSERLHSYANNGAEPVEGEKEGEWISIPKTEIEQQWKPKIFHLHTFFFQPVFRLAGMLRYYTSRVMWRSGSAILQHNGRMKCLSIEYGICWREWNVTQKWTAKWNWPRHVLCKGGGRGGRTLGHNGRRKEEKGSLCRWIVIVQMIIEKISHEFEERKQEKKRGVQKHTELGLNQSAREDTDRMRV